MCLEGDSEWAAAQQCWQWAARSGRQGVIRAGQSHSVPGCRAVPSRCLTSQCITHGSRESILGMASLGKTAASTACEVKQLRTVFSKCLFSIPAFLLGMGSQAAEDAVRVDCGWVFPGMEGTCTPQNVPQQPGPALIPLGTPSRCDVAVAAGKVSLPRSSHAPSQAANCPLHLCSLQGPLPLRATSPASVACCTEWQRTSDAAPSTHAVLRSVFRGNTVLFPSQAAH